ncbi:MAG: ATP-binding protein [Cyanobacteria bacterium SZAS LIN-2]|nr:ATP-binding protein [Cyanobacteria bacterium SZAS LIN-2]
MTVGKHFPPCYLDRLATVRLLSNLLDNSFKFTPSNGQISVTAEVVKEEIVLHVIDTGSGISADDRDMVFRKGKRSGKKTNRFTPGCGLGLYICREIVRAHHGRISFVSEVGVGTDFMVVLPVVPSQPL